MTEKFLAEIKHHPGYRSPRRSWARARSEYESSGLAQKDILGRLSPYVSGIFVLLVMYTLYFAAPVLIPITLALLLNMLLSPGVHLLNALKIPQSLAAAVVLIGAIILLAGAAYALSAPAQEWIQRIPTTFYKIEQKLSVLKEPFEKLREATEKFQQATELDHTPRTQQVEIRSPSLTDILLNGTPQVLAAIGPGTPQVLAAIGLVIILLFFLLASGDVFLRKLVSVIPSFHDKKRAVEIVRSIQQDISYYLLTITLVNICPGDLCHDGHGVSGHSKSHALGGGGGHSEFCTLCRRRYQFTDHDP